MTRLTWRTAGESHGKSLLGILEGIPAGFKLDIDAVDAELSRRQGGYGRGGRMKIERDHVEIQSGLKGGFHHNKMCRVGIRTRSWILCGCEYYHI